MGIRYWCIWDKVIVFAAGNSGYYGPYTINTPSNAKNAVAVGAAELYDMKSDEMLANQGITAVATFSSIGPTYDGKFIDA